MDTDFNPLYKSRERVDFEKVEALRESFGKNPDIKKNTFSCFDFYQNGDTTIHQYQDVINSILLKSLPPKDDDTKELASMSEYDAIARWIDSNTRGAMFVSSFVLELPLNPIFNPIIHPYTKNANFDPHYGWSRCTCQMDYARKLRAVFNPIVGPHKVVMFLFKTEDPDTGIPIIEMYRVPVNDFHNHPSTCSGSSIATLDGEIDYIIKHLESECASCTVRPYCQKDKYYNFDGLQLMGIGRVHAFSKPNYHRTMNEIWATIRHVLNSDRAVDNTVIIGIRRIDAMNVAVFNSIMDSYPNDDSRPNITSVPYNNDDDETFFRYHELGRVFYQINVNYSIANPCMNIIEDIDVKDAIGYLRESYDKESNRIHTTLLYFYPCNKSMRANKAVYFTHMPVNMFDWDWWKKDKE